VPDDPAIPHIKQGLEAGAAAALVVTDVASRVRTLLDTAKIGAGRQARRLRPSDIGILVPSQRRASEAASVLREWGIPTVRARTGSVLATPAARQWRLLLTGLAGPTDAGAAKAAGLSWFFDIAPGELIEPIDGADGVSRLAELQRQLAVLGEQLRRHGVGALYEHLRAQPVLLAAVLGHANGDRDLTDLDHLAELLVAELSGTPAEPAAVAATFDRMVAEADDQTEATMRRVETDDDAVHITTVHSAKGLEYPVVLVPFAYAERPAASRPYVFNDECGRVVDVASWVAWGDGVAEGTPEARKAVNERKRLAELEVDGDSLRLLYVAFTRAKHHLEIWWAPTRRAGTSALGRLLHDRWGAGPVFNCPPGDGFESVDAERTDTQVAALVAASNGTIARFVVPLAQPVRTPLPLLQPPASLLAVADAGGRHPLADPPRRLWSFTAIVAGVSAHVVSAAAAPLAGGYDEPPPADEGEPAGAPPPASTAPSAAMPLAAAPGGAIFGTAIHEVLEAVDFTSATLLADVAELVAAVARRSGLALDEAAITAGLVAVIGTPLGDLFGGRSLGDLGTADRLAELTFDLTFDGARVSAADIGEVLTDTLAPNDRLHAYGRQLAEALTPIELAGWLTGSIDAVFRTGGTEPRYVIVDYKSNRLHQRDAVDPMAAYRPDLLVAAMTHSHYPLQAVLYCVALHRYLRWRLGGHYEPERHLGGVAYLFVRGMVGAATPALDGEPYGVFSWRPPAATVVARDALFRSGRR
jgi:exodeoxyribonuclease V beta subunit